MRTRPVATSSTLSPFGTNTSHLSQDYEATQLIRLLVYREDLQVTLTGALRIRALPDDAATAQFVATLHTQLAEVNSRIRELSALPAPDGDASG